MKYYDKILTAIVLTLFAGAIVGLTTAVPLNAAVGSSALLSTAFMYHGMFQNAPVMGQQTSY